MKMSQTSNFVFTESFISSRTMLKRNIHLQAHKLNFSLDEKLRDRNQKENNLCFYNTLKEEIKICSFRNKLINETI